MSIYPAKAAGIPRGAFPTCGNSAEALTAQAAWQRHVDAGRIGTRITQTPEQRIRQYGNELAVLGARVVPGR